MNNSRERKCLNGIKRIICTMIAAILVTAMLPTTVFAAKEVVMATNGGLTIEGFPNAALPIGSGYEIKVVKEGAALVLKIYGPTSNPKYDGTVIHSSLPNTAKYISWNGLMIRDATEEEGWVEDSYCTFNVVDDNSNTTVSSNNIRLINFTTRNIKRYTNINPTFEIVDYNMEDDQVGSDVTPYLTGYSSNSSFALTSTDITITRVTNPTTGKFTFRMTMPLRYTGTGNSLSFTMAYRNKENILRTIDCTTTIPNTVPYVEDEDDDDDDDDDDPADTLIPYIIVDSYSYGGTSVTAGEDFTLTLKLRNTSTTHSLENIVMNVSPMGVFSMASSSNTFFINRLQAGSILERTVTLNAGLAKVTDDEDANSIDIKFTYQYLGNDDKALQSGNSSERITLPVNFPDRFELGIPEHDNMAFAGEEFYITVPMVNKGRSSVYNLTAFIRGDMRNPGQSQYIGNLNAGTESSADFSVVYDEPGDYSGEIVVTYEDANMNPKEVVAAFNISVEDMWGDGSDMPEFPDMPEEPTVPTDTQPQEDPVKPVKIVVGLVVCVMSAYVTIQKAKAKRSIFLDEDL